MKYLLLLLLIVGVIWFFFKDKKVISKSKDEEIMLECDECGTFASSSEMLHKNNKNYCSKECYKKGKK